MSDTQALLSVIVPIYNADKYLDKCIQSIIGQTYYNLEIILVNDGSTDNTETICLAYQDKDKRIKYLVQENHGVSVARKNGIAHSHGEYIAFVDADDYPDRDMYEKLIRAIDENDCDIAECAYHQIYENEKKTISIGDNNTLIAGSDKCLERLVMIGGREAVLWNKVYKRTLINIDDLGEYHFSEDYLWNVIFHSKCYKKVILKECLYYHLINSNSACNNNFGEKKLDSIYALIDARNYVISEGLECADYITRTILEYCSILYTESKQRGNLRLCKKIKELFDDNFDSYKVGKLTSLAGKAGFLTFRYSPTAYAIGRKAWLRVSK